MVKSIGERWIWYETDDHGSDYRLIDVGCVYEYHATTGKQCGNATFGNTLSHSSTDYANLGDGYANCYSGTCRAGGTAG